MKECKVCNEYARKLSSTAESLDRVTIALGEAAHRRGRRCPGGEAVDAPYVTEFTVSVGSAFPLPMSGNSFNLPDLINILIAAERREFSAVITDVRERDYRVHGSSI